MLEVKLRYSSGLGIPDLRSPTQDRTFDLFANFCFLGARAMVKYSDLHFKFKTVNENNVRKSKKMAQSQMNFMMMGSMVVQWAV